MKPIDENNYYDSSQEDDHNDFSDTPQEDEPTQERPSALQLLKKYWLLAAAFLVLALFGSLYFWLQSAKKAAYASKEPVAASTENIDSALPERSTDDIKTKSPSSVLEERRRAEEMSDRSRPAPTAEQVVTTFIVDTVGQAAYIKQKQLHTQKQEESTVEIDTIETTVQEPTTGVYRTKKVAVPSPRTRQRTSASRKPAYQPKSEEAPAYDTDGTPFETDPKMLRMLSVVTPEARAVYEKASGKRYRDTEAQAQEKMLQASTVSPGEDGFYTYHQEGAQYKPGKQSQQLTPDTFFKCVINGEQSVRSGSVITMRLMEDAVVGGITFPKNMVFAGVASIQSNRIVVEIERLGATRVQADIFDFNYMPGIMIDPEKKAARDVNDSYNTIQQQSAQEIGTAIDRSASAANSIAGVAGRVAASAVGRIKPSRKLRQVLLPDGYPLLITTAAAGQ